MSMVMLLLAVGAYSLATATFLIHVVGGKQWSRRLGDVALIVGASAHAVAWGLRLAAFGYRALAPLPEQLSAMALFAVAVYLLVSLRVSLSAVGAAVAPLAAIASVSAYFFEAGGPPQTVPPSGLWVPFHVGPTLLGYGVFALSFCLSLAYLVQERQLKGKARSGIFRRLPSLQTLDEWNHRFVVWGFVFFTVGIVSGSWLAKQRWGELWSWDPVQTWSGGAWVLYASLLHLRSVGWRGKRAAQLVVWSFLFLLVSFIGVSMFFPGRHGVQTTWTRNS